MFSLAGASSTCGSASGSAAAGSSAGSYRSAAGSLSFDAVGGSADVVVVKVSASTSAVAADEPPGVSASPRCEASAAASQPTFAIDAWALREAPLSAAHKPLRLFKLTVRWTPVI